MVRKPPAAMPLFKPAPQKRADVEKEEERDAEEEGKEDLEGVLQNTMEEICDILGSMSAVHLIKLAGDQAPRLQHLLTQR